MQSYNYDKYNRTIETNTILLLQSWAEGQVKQNMGVNKGRWEHSLVRRYFVKRSSKFTRTGIFLFAPCPLSLTQIVVRCFDKLRGDLFKYKSPPAVFSSKCLLSLINGKRQISLCLLSFKLLLGSRCHPALLRTLSSLSNSLPRCQKWKFFRSVTLTLDFLNTVLMCLLPFKPFPPFYLQNSKFCKMHVFRVNFLINFMILGC